MSNAITGYRNSFYGTMDNKPKELLSDDIRNLTGKSKKNLKTKNILQTILHQCKIIEIWLILEF
jgi:hypothetical protein